MTQKNKLKHKLKNRHLQMIALGGVIGTGLFFGSAKSIHLTGPSIVLSYILCGIVMFIIMRALGEMSVYKPNSGSFSEYAHEYIGPYAGFIAGWNAWFEYTIVCMTELTAVGFFLDYWIPGVPHWETCLVLLMFFTTVNLISVRFFGEFEFYFAGIKIIAIVLMLAFSAYIIFFKHGLNPDINLYKDPSYLFAGGIKGFAISLVIVVFSFGGTEFVSIAAGEAENPKKNIPLAINGVIIRILLFYVLTMLAIVCLYPFEKLATNVSPFVDVFQKIGIPVAAQVMNVVAITAALSAFNSCLYSSSRMLYNLSLHGNSGANLAKTNKAGIPYQAILWTSFAILIAVVINYIFPEKALMYLLTIATGAILITWFIILISQLRFRNIHKSISKQLDFKLRLFPYSSIFAILMLFIVMIVMTQMDEMKLSAYITPFWILLLTVLYVLRKKTLNK
ncbi:MAG: amino acid permease [Proteobacteria bacterium]|nr:amino acid permease [Pseudomonadota bacterium]